MACLTFQKGMAAFVAVSGLVIVSIWRGIPNVVYNGLSPTSYFHGATRSVC